MAINTAIDAENRINALLKELGAFRSVRFTPVLSHSAAASDTAYLSRNMAAAVLAGDLGTLNAIIDYAEADGSNAELSSEQFSRTELPVL